MIFIQPAILLAALSVSVSAYPLNKRIAQNTPDSTKKWEAACNAAGGGLQCNPVAVNAFGTLLAAAGPCDQQNAADAMVDLAKTLNNDPNMIKFAQIFAQQPRNSPTSLSVPYCTTAPKNAELNGFFQCQFASTNPTTFVSSPNNLQVGDSGTIPFGLSSPVSPAGSCPANPSGPVPDGEQLTDITQNPGVGGSTSSSNSGSGAAAVAASSASQAATITASASAADATSAGTIGDDGCETVTVTVTAADGNNAAAAATSTQAAATSASTASTSTASDFQHQNAIDAQTLNAQFEGLTASDSCTDGSQACVADPSGVPAFAQCVQSEWVLSPCGPTTQCLALPLENKAGTSITCTTLADGQSRIANFGVSGGVDGKGN